MKKALLDKLVLVLIVYILVVMGLVITALAMGTYYFLFKNVWSMIYG